MHRVGRVARAGRSGTAYSIVSFDELPFVYELSLFLNHPFKTSTENSTAKETGLYGPVPQHILDEENESIRKHIETKKDLRDMLKVCENAYKHYLKTREKVSGESVRKMKQYSGESIAYHPIFKYDITNQSTDEEERKKNSLLESIKNFKTSSTIFEIDRKKQKANSVINETRKYFQNVIEKRVKTKELEDQQDEYEKQTETADYKDDDHYLPYLSKDHHSERGLQVNENRSLLQSAVFSVQGDEEDDLRKSKLNEKRWDRKKKKFVGEIEDIRAKKFKTESGNWISASFKTDMFKRWKEKNKIETTSGLENTVSFEDDDKQKLKKRNEEVMNMVSNKYKTKGMKANKSELKDKGEIIKKRMIKQRHDRYQDQKQDKKGRKGNSKGSKRSTYNKRSSVGNAMNRKKGSKRNSAGFKRGGGRRPRK